MIWTRRAFLETLTASMAVRVLSAAAGSRAADWRAALDAAPRSTCFGLAAGGQALDRASLFRLATPGGAPLSFDISNTRILCSLSANGELSRACVSTGVMPLPVAKLQGGVYTEKVLIRGGPWKFDVHQGGHQGGGAPLTADLPSRVEWLGHAVPLFTWQNDALVIRQVAFAPVDRLHPDRSPRAIFVVFWVQNRLSSDLDITVSMPADARAAAQDSGSSGWLAFGPASLRLAPGAEAIVETAMLLEDAPASAAQAREEIEQRTVLAWFQDTLRAGQTRYGTLAIDDAPAFAESVPRYAETCRQSVLRSGPDGIDGGFLGSDVDTRSITWNRDTFYSMLAMAMFEPELCAAAIPFFMKWGVPPRPTARGLARFPDAAPVTQSLGNTLAPLALSAACYRFTGNREYFLRQPAFLHDAEALLDAVLATRRGDAWLFPSMFISNGDSRGDAHTGSNVLAWYAFDGMARIAGDVYGDRARQAAWNTVAQQIRSSIMQVCTGTGPRGRQFFEGVFDDRTYVPGHDGEESDTTLMPFYGFCDADEPLLLRHASLALTPMNPYYADGLDAIWWHNHGGFRPATMPGWMTALASATTEEEVEARLERIRQVTDLDGSLWWWPYRHGESDRSAVLRGNGAGKCGWASAIYLLRFVHVVLGLDVDVPARRLRVRPFCPWPHAAWRDARLGAARFDLSYARDTAAGTSSVDIRNLNADSFEVTIELRMPAASRDARCDVDGVRTDWRRGRYFERDTMCVTRTVPPGRTMRVQCLT